MTIPTARPADAAGRHRALRRLGILLAVAFIAALTLAPGPGGGAFPLACIACGEEGARDFLLNLALFAPLGLALAADGVARGRIPLLALLLSTGIEGAQWLLPLGRYPIAGDVVANVLGAAVGATMWRVRWSRLGATPWAFAAAGVGWTVACFLGAWALGVAPLEGASLHGQWARKFDDTERFGGRLTGAMVNGVSVPDWEVAAVDSIARPFERGRFRLQLELIGLPPSAGWAQVFGFTDGHQPPSLEVALIGCDARLQARVRGSSIRLGTLVLVASDACRPLDEVLLLEGTMTSGRAAIHVTRQGTTPSATEARLTAASLWRLLLPFPRLGRWEGAWSFVWLGAWGVLLGLASPAGTRGGWPASVVLVATLLLAVEALAGWGWDRAAPTLPEWLGAVAGATAGTLLARLLQTRGAYRRAASRRSVP